MRWGESVLSWGRNGVGEVRLTVYCPCITNGRCIVVPWDARVRTGVVTWNPKGSSLITVNSDPVIVTILVSALLGGSGILHCTAPRLCVCARYAVEICRLCLQFILCPSVCTTLDTPSGIHSCLTDRPIRRHAIPVYRPHATRPRPLQQAYPHRR